MAASHLELNDNYSRKSKSKSKLCYDQRSVGQSVLVSTLRPDFYYCQTVMGLLMWGTLSDKRTGLPFTIGAGPSVTGLVTIFYCFKFKTPPTWRARPPYSYHPGTGWPSYTPRHWVPFSSPPTTPLAYVKVMLRLTVTQSVSLGVKPHLGLMTRYLLLFGSYGLIFVGRPL
jgi:hypothetical protein